MLDRRVLEQSRQWQFSAQITPDAGHETHREKRVPAQVEEAVGHPDRSDSEQFLPDERQSELHRVARRHDRPTVRTVDSRQRLAVHLAIGGERQRVEHHERRRHHVLRQPLAQRPTQRLGRDLAHHVGDQTPVAGSVLPCQDRRLADLRPGHERRLDLPHLDAESANFHLMVSAAQEIDRPIRQVASQVAASVKPFAHGAEGVRNKARSGQIRAVQVPSAHPIAADIDLAERSDRSRFEFRVQDQHPTTGDWPADRDRPRSGHHHFMDRAAHHCFRRAVFVPQPHAGSVLAPECELFERERFSADHERPGAASGPFGWQ